MPACRTAMDVRRERFHEAQTLSRSHPHPERSHPQDAQVKRPCDCVLGQLMVSRNQSNVVSQPKQWHRVGKPVHDTNETEKRYPVSHSVVPFLVSGPWNPTQDERSNDLRQGCVIKTSCPQSYRDD